MSKTQIASRIARVTAAGLSVVLLAVSTVLGMLMNYLFVFLMISAVFMVMTLIIAVARKKVHWRISKVTSARVYYLTGLLRNATWIVMGVCVHIAIVPIQFSPEEITTVRLLLWGSVFTLCLASWIPRNGTRKSVNIALSVFLFFLSLQLVMTYTQPRTTLHIDMNTPFSGDGYVFQGGNSILTNHHHFAGSQKYALDLIVADDGKLPMESISDLNQYETFGQDLYSPVAGVVVAVENSLPDQEIGALDRTNIAGNHVVVRTAADAFVFMAHLKKGSVLVAEGDTVRAGQTIAKIGNSGYSTQPHLHIQAMTEADFSSANSNPIPLSFTAGDGRPKYMKRNDIVPGLAN